MVKVIFHQNIFFLARYMYIRNSVGYFLFGKRCSSKSGNDRTLAQQEMAVLVLDTVQNAFLAKCQTIKMADF